MVVAAVWFELRTVMTVVLRTCNHDGGEVTTRNSRFSCGIKWKIRRKQVSCRFCQGFALPGNTFVGNCFLRIFETAGKANNIRRKCLVRVGEIPLPVNISCEHSAWNSTANFSGNAAGELFPQVIPQENEQIRRKIPRKFNGSSRQFVSLVQFFDYFLLVNANNHIKSHFNYLFDIEVYLFF